VQEQSRRSSGFTYLPEFNIAVFALLLNWPWEFLQVPFFREMPSAEHWEGVRTCTRAALGDAVIMLVAYWTVSVRSGRYWLLRPSASQLCVFLAVGLAITVVIEKLAVSRLWMDGWSYSDLMPLVPFLDVGLTPVLQWIVLPPLAVWFCKRQLGPGVDQGR
jgi:hypothetical protein